MKTKSGISKIVAMVAVIIIVIGVAGAYYILNPQTTVTLTGAGATFPEPLIKKWTSEYHKLNPSVVINYQGIGSGGGIQQIQQKIVDFAGTDAPLSDEEMTTGELVHIPETLAAVVVAYNIPEFTGTLKFDGEVIAQIYLGNITKWNDPKIVALNPELSLPNENIFVAHRSDGSGTTYIFTDYLSAISQEWSDEVGKGKSVNWPVGVGAQGNPGVAGLVQQNPYSIGYVEIAYAYLNNMPYAWIKNEFSEEFIEPTLESVSKAAEGFLDQMQEDVRVSIVNSPDPEAYPIASFTYILLYKEQNVYGEKTNFEKSKALLNFVWWAVHEGQSYSESLHYAELPQEVVVICEDLLRSITYNGQPIITS
ncbi:MAG: phosphate ABC transporter substrate-binding protein PstS [archaeon]|nr:phosphate ABC transporter substrate-binding protein PstS [archaeon]MCP8316989.1 phosphate ABC transporter substrate-binding protein PstS [archaeon]MCP8321475.1 phosphate ABC transporter substrate-binding protein PstS [archaeon]